MNRLPQNDEWLWQQKLSEATPILQRLKTTRTLVVASGIASGLYVAGSWLLSLAGDRTSVPYPGSLYPLIMLGISSGALLGWLMLTQRISTIQTELDVEKSKLRATGSILADTFDRPGATIEASASGALAGDGSDGISMSVISPGTPSPVPYFDRFVEINVSNLKDYYGLVRIHTNNSFYVATSVGILGFMLMMTGLAVGFINNSNMQLSFVATGAGIIVEFISGVFFFLYNRTVQQLKEYHDSLIRVQNVLLSVKIAQDATNADARTAIIAQLVGNMVGGQSLEVIGSDKGSGKSPKAENTE